MYETIFFLVIIAIIMEIIDSSLGMMFGTILSPILIGIGYEPLIVVPAILVSQGFGGLSGTISHHKFRNADFNGFTKDTKVALAMIVPGVFVVFIGVACAINIPTIYVKSYIAILVIIMSLLCVSKFKYKFAWWKHYVIGAIASFNKAISGGGFGPVTSTGGIIGGLKSKISIATTTFSELVICFVAFAVYLTYNNELNVLLICTLSVGAFIGGIIGPIISSKLNHKSLRKIIGVVGVISGMWLILKLVDIL